MKCGTRKFRYGEKSFALSETISERGGKSKTDDEKRLALVGQEKN